LLFIALKILPFQGRINIKLPAEVILNT